MRCANMTQVDPGTKNSGRKHSRGPSKHPRTQAPPPSLSLVLTGFGIERLGACERGGGEGGGAHERARAREARSFGAINSRARVHGLSLRPLISPAGKRFTETV